MQPFIICTSDIFYAMANHVFIANNAIMIMIINNIPIPYPNKEKQKQR